MADTSIDEFRNSFSAIYDDKPSVVDTSLVPVEGFQSDNLSLALDDYMDGVEEADMALEHISRLHAMVQAQESLSDTSLKFVRLSLQSWQNYLKVPGHLVPKFENDNATNQEAAAGETKGFFQTIIDFIRNTLKAILNGIKNLFGLNDEKKAEANDATIAAAIANPEAGVEAIKKKSKKNDHGEDVTEFKGLKNLGLKDKVLTLERLNKVADTFNKRVKVAEQLNGVFHKVCKALQEDYEAVASASKEYDIRRLYSTARTAMDEIKQIIGSNGVKPTKEILEKFGTDEGEVVVMPLIENVLFIGFKFINSTPIKIQTQIISFTVEGACDSLSVKELHPNKYLAYCVSMKNINTENKKSIKNFQEMTKQITSLNKVVDGMAKVNSEGMGNDARDYLRALGVINTNIGQLCKALGSLPNIIGKSFNVFNTVIGNAKKGENASA